MRYRHYSEMSDMSYRSKKSEYRASGKLQEIHAMAPTYSR